MSTSRPFAYNPSRTPIPGTEQVGDLAIGISQQYYSEGIGGVRWWMGPNEDPGYIICYPFSAGTRPSPDGNIAYIGFKRSQNKTEESFVAMSNAFASGQATFTTGTQAYVWLNANGYWTSYNPLTPTPTSTEVPVTPTPSSTSEPQPTPTATSTEVPVTPTPSSTSEPQPTPTATSTEVPVTPTPSSTSEPQPTPTETPTNTPTPSVTPEPVTGYSFNLVALPYNFPTSGNTIMNSEGGITSGSTNPNVLATGSRGLYWNSIDSDGVDRTNYFSAFTGQSVTITMSQTGSTAIYSGDTNSLKTWVAAGPGTGFVFGAGVGVPPSNIPSGTATLIQSASTQWTIGLPVYISVVVNGGVTPTPTQTSTPTPTQTPTITPTSSLNPTPTSTQTPTPTTPFELKIESALSTVTINNLIATGGLTYNLTLGSFPITNSFVLGTHSATGTLNSNDVQLNFDATTTSTFTVTKNGVEIVNFPSSSGLNQTYQLGGQFSNLLSTDVMVLKFA